MGKSSDFVELLTEAVDAEKVLPAQGRLVVGVSGGADSVALLHGMHALNRARNLPWRIHVGHLNHGIRGPAAEEDARFVLDLASQLDLPATVEHVDVPGLAKARQMSIEEAAREARYAFFERICLHTESRHIVLAHPADDNAELRGLGVADVFTPGAPTSSIVDYLTSHVAV